MSRLSMLWRNIVRRGAADDELDAEIDATVDLLADEHLARGLPADAARRAALRQLGSTAVVKDAVRDARVGATVVEIARDAGYALRLLRRDPGFAAAAIVSLALGIGASTGIFSMVNGIVLRPLPFPGADRILFISESNGHQNYVSVSWPNFLDWRARSRAFESLAASRPDTFVLTGGRPAERLSGRHVTANFFHVLGVQPLLGRDFTDGDDRAGAVPVVMLSHQFWRTAMGASPDAPGATLTLDGRPYVVAGVLPEGFEYGQPHDVFVPMGPIQGLPYIRQRSDHAGYYALGRLKDDATMERATSDLRAIAANLRREHPDTNIDIDAHVEPLLTRIVADVRATLFALLGAVGFLLLLACVNVANLLVARGAARRRELVIRAALGGGRLRIVRQLLVESTVLSAIGGAAGIIVATVLLRALVAAAPQGTPRLGEVSIDRAALLFALGAVALCGGLFGLFPAFQASRVDGHDSMIRGRGVAAAAASHRLRRTLIAAEVALALVLLTGAGLMMRTLARLTHVDPGFRADHLLTLRTSFRGPRWTHDRRVATIGESLTRIDALPGVVRAAATSALPIDRSDWNSPFVAADKPTPSRRDLPFSAFTIVSPGYFETMQTALLAGRTFSDDDTDRSARVVVVNDSLARRIWPDESPIGKRLKQGFPEGQAPWRDVIGVVADVKFEGVAEETPLQVYMPVAQERAGDFAFVVRASVAPATLQTPITAAIHALDRDVPIYRVRTMESILGAAVGRERLAVLVGSVFGVVALVLASVGLYGLIAHSVAERIHEIGVRIALGAERGDVIALVVRQGLTMAIAGVAVGVAVSLAVAPSIKTLLFGVGPADPLTFAAVIAVLVAVAGVACLLPAWRATSVDPAQALRAE